MRKQWKASSAIVAAFSVAMIAWQSGTAKSYVPAEAGEHDISGVWLFDTNLYHASFNNPGLYGLSPRQAPPMTPWAQAKYAAAKPGYRVGTGAEDNDPALHCDPLGMPRIMGPGPFEIIQIPGRILVLFEEAYTRRTIWTDGRGLPKDPDPTWYGYSVGKWEGDTLVVDTIGFDDRSWLDGAGHPHSDAMHVVERYRRVNHDTLELTMRIDDPKAYAKPWVSSAPQVYKLQPKYELLETPCVPEDEASFLKTVREPAASKPVK